MDRLRIPLQAELVVSAGELGDAVATLMLQGAREYGSIKVTAFSIDVPLNLRGYWDKWVQEGDVELSIVVTSILRPKAGTVDSSASDTPFATHEGAVFIDVSGLDQQHELLPAIRSLRVTAARQNGRSLLLFRGIGEPYHSRLWSERGLNLTRLLDVAESEPEAFDEACRQIKYFGTGLRDYLVDFARKYGRAD